MQQRQEKIIEVCLVCSDKSTGITCTRNENTTPPPFSYFLRNKTKLTHFLCHDCFCNSVKSQVSFEELEIFKERESRVCCYFCNQSDPSAELSIFSERNIALHADDETFALYRKAVSDVLEGEITLRVEEAEKKRADMERNSETEGQRIRVNQLRNALSQDILNVRCPNSRCNVPITLDFDGCFAVQCGSCKKEFCAWCLTHFPSKNHLELAGHVIFCKENSSFFGVFGTLESLFLQTNVRLADKRKDQVQHFIETRVEKRDRDLFLKTIKKDLDSLKISVGSRERGLIENIKGRVAEFFRYGIRMNRWFIVLCELIFTFMLGLFFVIIVFSFIKAKF